MAKEEGAPVTSATKDEAVRFQQLRLLVALDALLREASVSRAAATLGLQTSSMSRMLGELREIYGDRIFIRTGRGMSPTPFAESIRQRVRTLVTETEALMLKDGAALTASAGTLGDGWTGRTLMPMAPLAATRSDRLDASPTPAILARRIASIGDNAAPQRRLAKYIAITSPGPGKSRPMTTEEARDAFTIVLSGEADPVQVGALLMTMQYRGVTTAELAGFVQAIRGRIPPVPDALGRPDLDWPAYVSASWRHPPWFIHAARLVASGGYKVLIHGFFGNGEESGKLELAAADAGIRVCLSVAEAAQALSQSNLAYVPIGALVPQVQSLLGLYPLFETRTPVHALPHLVNPMAAPCIVLGAAQMSRRDLYRDVARQLGEKDVTILGSVRDFAQFTPLKATPLYRIVEGQSEDVIVPAQRDVSQIATPPILSQREYWRAVWTGAARDEYAEATIVKTAAAALLCLAKDRAVSFESALEHAVHLWQKRDRHG